MAENNILTPNPFCPLLYPGCEYKVIVCNMLVTMVNKLISLNSACSLRKLQKENVPSLFQ